MAAPGTNPSFGPACVIVSLDPLPEGSLRPVLRSQGTLFGLDCGINPHLLFGVTTIAPGFPWIHNGPALSPVPPDGTQVPVPPFSDIRPLIGVNILPVEMLIRSDGSLFDGYVQLSSIRVASDWTAASSLFIRDGCKSWMHERRLLSTNHSPDLISSKYYGVLQFDNTLIQHLA